MHLMLRCLLLALFLHLQMAILFKYQFRTCLLRDQLEDLFLSLSCPLPVPSSSSGRASATGTAAEHKASWMTGETGTAHLDMDTGKKTTDTQNEMGTDSTAE